MIFPYTSRHFSAETPNLSNMAFSSMPSTEEGWAELENEYKDRRPTEECSAIEDSIAYTLSLMSESSELGQRLAAMQSKWAALSSGDVGLEEKTQLGAQLTSEAQALLATLNLDAQDNAASRIELEADYSQLTSGQDRSDQSAACAQVIKSALDEARMFHQVLQEGMASCHICITGCASVLAESSAKA
ncbi:hypothetical protein [Ottowia thiooxydans]|uniref:Uncharacterized protein n=1 Tax=Ottowia thiooxydans TaxID=219182 RepID=A0ABV2QEM4_9BURK